MYRSVCLCIVCIQYKFHQAFSTTLVLSNSCVTNLTQFTKKIQEVFREHQICVKHCARCYIELRKKEKEETKWGRREEGREEWVKGGGKTRKERKERSVHGNEGEGETSWKEERREEKKKNVYSDITVLINIGTLFHLLSISVLKEILFPQPYRGRNRLRKAKYIA